MNIRARRVFVIKRNKRVINSMKNANSGLNSVENRKKDKNENFSVPVDISAKSYTSTPETAEEMVNTYGTYNIQPTADTDDDFPAIAQGETKQIKERPLEFFRGPNDPNPAADMSGEDCI